MPIKIKKYIPLKKTAYVIKKSCRLVCDCWGNSSKLSEKKIKCRFFGFCDLLYSLIRYGADYSNYMCFQFYKLKGKDRNKFVTFWRNERLWRIFCKDTHKLFLDKTSFNINFNKYILRDWIDTNNCSYEEIEKFVGQHKSIIVKPLASAMGNGVFKLECPDKSSIPLIIEKHITPLGGVIIEETLENIPELKRLNPPSLNTVRMVTVIDGKGQYHLVAARMRMGANNSCTDNVCNGGLVCAIDEKNGLICSSAKDHLGNEYSIHPNTGVNLIGYKIPHWNECLELTKRLAHTIPSARYVGWDLAITTKGIDVLEGNIPPDESVTQMNHEVGLWNNFLSWI